MDDCQYSNPIYPNQPTGKILELTYLHNLSTDHLITVKSSLFSILKFKYHRLKSSHQCLSLDKLKATVCQRVAYVEPYDGVGLNSPIKENFGW